MPTKTLVSFLGKETPEFEGRVLYKNPRLFTGKVPAVADYVITDKAHILEAYKIKGVKDYGEVYTAKGTASGTPADQLSPSRESESDSSDERGSQRQPDRDSSAEFTTSERVKETEDGVQQTQKEEQVIPDNFSELSFFEQRAIAQKLTDEKVINKEDVQRVIAQHQ